MASRTQKAASVFSGRIAIAVAVAFAITVAGCGDGDDDAASKEPATSTTAAPAPDFEEHLMFSRFNESTHTFSSTHVANPDGSEEHEISLPGPEGGGRWSRDGARIAVMTLVENEWVGTAVIAPDGPARRDAEPRMCGVVTGRLPSGLPGLGRHRPVAQRYLHGQFYRWQ